MRVRRERESRGHGKKAGSKGGWESDKREGLVTGKKEGKETCKFG